MKYLYYFAGVFVGVFCMQILRYWYVYRWSRHAYAELDRHRFDAPYEF